MLLNAKAGCHGPVELNTPLQGRRDWPDVRPVTRSIGARDNVGLGTGVRGGGALYTANAGIADSDPGTQQGRGIR
ncbi:hypothetical protein R6Q59_008407 [Mikania micrantha]